MICTFFGHRDATSDIKPKLYNLLCDLIENQQADLFYVGNQGNFDVLVKSVLTSLKEKYPHIRYYVVLAYLPKKDDIDFSDTIYPEGLENVPQKYAISRRNKWLVQISNTVITHVTHPWGGAAQFKELAEALNKNVINIT